MIISKQSDSNQDIEEAEETLSLSDLPIFNDTTSYLEEPQPSDHHQPFFEFYSEEWSTTTADPTDGILFCGKMITSKEPVADELESSKLYGEKRLRSLFRWNSDSLIKHTKRCSKSKRTSITTKRSKSLPVQWSIRGPKKMSWYFFIFGLGRFDPVGKMELCDIKNRQLRKNHEVAAMAAVRREDGDVAVGGGGKGLWGLVKALSCGGGNHANAMVKTSFGCIPPV